MFDHERRLYAFAQGYLHKLVADIDNDQFAVSPLPGMNHAAWTIGHLAVVGDMGVAQLGESAILNKRWGVLFGPGSALRNEPAVYPDKAELLAAYDDAHARLTAASRSADPEAMAAPHKVSIAFMKGYIDTVGELVAHIMTTHEAAHVGQLSAWRRALGREGVLTL